MASILTAWTGSRPARFWAVWLWASGWISLYFLSSSQKQGGSGDKSCASLPMLLWRANEWCLESSRSLGTASAQWMSAMGKRLWSMDSGQAWQMHLHILLRPPALLWNKSMRLGPVGLGTQVASWGGLEVLNHFYFPENIFIMWLALFF